MPRLARLLTTTLLALAACAEEPACRYDVDCGEGRACSDGACVALDLTEAGLSCFEDADCSAGELCYNRLCWSGEVFPEPQYCPETPLADWLVCSGHDPQACPCFAGEVAFHEREQDGRQSCDGITGIFSERVRLVQRGCHLDALGGELSAEAYGTSALLLRIAQLPDDVPCETVEEPWSPRGRPALRITCSPTCTIWMERFLPAAPERLIPGGTFLMGSAPAPGVAADEQPEHFVNELCFSIDRFEVTRADYLECLDVGACAPPDLTAAGVGESRFFAPADAALPMTFVTFEQAEKYCRFRDKAVPTEAEWELAAQGGATKMHAYPWGDDAPFDDSGAPDCGLANAAGCAGAPLRATAADGSAARARGASHFDVIDLAGNVREWTRDFYRPDAYTVHAADAGRRGVMNPEEDRPHDGLRARVVRGGSFRSEASRPGATPTDALRSSDRTFEPEATAADDLGLRCVRYKPGIAR